MNLIPSKRVLLNTYLSHEKVKNILDEAIIPKRSAVLHLGKSKSNALFEGVVSEDQFRIQRIINYRNSFLPEIIGHFNSSLNGTKIDLNFKIQPFVLVFMGIWFGTLSIALMAILVGIFAQGANPMAILAPLVMLIFGFALVYFGFHKEVAKAISELRSILNARIH